MSFTAIILAAGKGTRLKSELAKPMHRVGGRTLLSWVISVADTAGANQIMLVINSDAEALANEANNRAEIIIQEPPQGTGHAVFSCLAPLSRLPVDEPVIILFADTPLITPQSIENMAAALNNGADLCALGFDASEPGGYGRMILTASGQLEKIVEDRDASEAEKSLTLVNGGLMAVRAGILCRLLPLLRADNSQGEYYLSDLVSLANDEGLTCRFVTAHQDEVSGVNDRRQLAQIEAVIQTRLRHHALANGVTMMAPETVFLSADTKFGRDVILEPHIVIGVGVEIGHSTIIKSFSYIEGTKTKAHCIIGPYARLRPGTELGESVKIGNFVEVKNAKIDDNAKANHLSYIGDAEVGQSANIGAGTITCNYDGINKHKTSIGAYAFIGSNTALVAPVRIGDNALIGAGSTITRDVEANAIALSRAKQKQIAGGNDARRKKTKPKP